jgi:hypothetical protein
MARVTTLLVVLVTPIAACSNQAAPLVDGGGTTTAGSTSVGVSSTTTTTSGEMSTTTTTTTSGGTSSGTQPITVTLNQMDVLGCSDGCSGIGETSTTGGSNAMWQVYSLGASLALASGNAFAPRDFDCPSGALTGGGCCVAPLATFGVPDAGCSGSATVAIPTYGNLQADPSAGCTEVNTSYYYSSLLSVTGITREDAGWMISVAVPSNNVNRPLGACPALSLSNGATFTWPMAYGASVHGLTIDAMLAGGGVMRIACTAVEDAGTLDVPAGVLAHFSGAQSARVTSYDLTEVLIDAGETPIDIRAETSVQDPYNSVPYGPCPISP